MEINNTKTRLQEVDHELDLIDEEIMTKYPECEHAHLHYLIMEKVKYEKERMQYV